ncbi:hypothetical protein V8J82_15315 [Gymnodinialimonas sp. 2305UL16-5]|uniref:hypothetical protein n=1 Tax=Gymnodinialimonas mytili TaxID=3126503 RepID=UPI0030B79F55
MFTNTTNWSAATTAAPTGPTRLAKRVVDILRDPDLRKISYTFDKITISPHDFQAVIHAIECGQVKVRLAKAQEVDSFTAAYSLPANEIIVRSEAFLDTISGKAVAVHEAVHVAKDIRRMTWRTRKGEAAAFCAQAWYLSLKGQRYPMVYYDPHVFFFYVVSQFRKRIEAGDAVPVASDREIADSLMYLTQKGYNTDIDQIGDGVGEGC